MKDIRDNLWAETWTLWYHAFYTEKASEFMLNRWLLLDHISRILVALFASSSAVAGWSLWSAESGKVWWATLAGSAALASIITGALGVQDRVKRFAETKTVFTRLRIRVDAVLAEMRIRHDFDVQLVQDAYHKVQEIYAEAFQSYPHDLFFTQHAQDCVQRALDRSIHSLQRNPHTGPTA